ncbi:bucky ball-like isoform X2 [Phyllopteryx taeniolatus]|uniref:bucky ball-like isoform X2 n=1 Tax=Phyllopteryx taeniolatus TaxID=161469 RepID=UPI002AD3D905|nr:bucky ball-like isoform X2 [Phyllopteryx taeniolatus]
MQGSTLRMCPDGGKPPHSCGNGQQRSHHPRPFFYVQPPSQPYYLYQHWQMNNPYNHYGVPAGFNFGRPYMAPYQFMPYPGFVFPHAPLYPVDYRRMFEPRFCGPIWNDGPRPQHQQQSHGRRETASSEVQTDPSDAISKLMECLDKIRVTERQGAERELDSGVASHSSGMFSPAEEKRCQEECETNLLPAAPDATRLESPAVVFSDSTAAVYDAESSHRSLEFLSPQVCWSGTLEVELPIDSSSIHEDGPDPECPSPLEPFLAHDKSEVTNIQSDIPVADRSAPISDANDAVKRADSYRPPSLSPISLFRKLKDEKSVSKALSEVDPDYQILQLPLHVFTSGEGSRVSSPASPYYHHRLSMQTTHERMSVLSPSLDEFSSRDEMFSTDLEDSDIFPRRAYTGRRLAEVVGGERAVVEVAEDTWLPAPTRLMCACCGKSLPKGGSRGKGHSAKAYRDEAADSEDDVGYGRGCEPPFRAALRKHPAPRKPHPGPQRQPARPWYKRSQYKTPLDSHNPDQGHEGKSGETSGGELQCRTCQDGLCRDEHGVSEQSKWAESSGGAPRRWQVAPLQRQESSAPRKAMLHQRPRDDDGGRDDDDDKELPTLHWDRGSSVRESRS